MMRAGCALKLETSPATPGAGEVRVKVLHAAVNPIALFSRLPPMCPATIFPYAVGEWHTAWPLATQLTRGCSRTYVRARMGRTLSSSLAAGRDQLSLAWRTRQSDWPQDKKMTRGCSRQCPSRAERRAVTGRNYLSPSQPTERTACTASQDARSQVRDVASILKSDGDDLKAMVKVDCSTRAEAQGACVDEHFAFDKVDAPSKVYALQRASGGKLVIDVASPAPSESCCVVACGLCPVPATTGH